MSIFRGTNNIVTDGLILYLDTANYNSYPGVDVANPNIWYSLIKNPNKTILNTTNPSPWSPTCFSTLDGTPTSVHFVNSNACSSNWCGLGFSLLNKKVIKYSTWRIKCNLEVTEGEIRLCMGSSGGGYTEGPQLLYTGGTYKIDIVLYVDDYYNHEANTLQFAVSSFSVDAEATITNLEVTENNYDATLMDGASFSDKKISLDGINDFIGGFVPATDISSQFTLNVWCKPIDVGNSGGTAYLGLVNRYNGVNAQRNRFLLSGGFNSFYFQPYIGATSYDVFSDTFSSIQNQVSMCTVTYDGDMRFYLNGDSVLSTPYSLSGGTLNTDNYHFILGRGADSADYYFYGDFYIYQVYNRALSDSEVLQNFNSLKKRFGL